MPALSRPGAWFAAFPVEFNSADGKDVFVRRANVLVAAVMAVLWLPVTMHCALESISGFSFLTCCAHEDAVPHEDDDCETDACAVVESGFYKIQDHEDLVAASADAEVAAPFEADVVRRGSGSAGMPPPTCDSSVGWQFSSRAAPLPRAPSSLI
jgi:hypothetical protein